MNGTKRPAAITTDQAFYALILDELTRIRLGIEALVAGTIDSDETTCGECGRRFANARALAAHIRVHKEG